MTYFPALENRTNFFVKKFNDVARNVLGSIHRLEQEPNAPNGLTYSASKVVDGSWKKLVILHLNQATGVTTISFRVDLKNDEKSIDLFRAVPESWLTFTTAPMNSSVEEVLRQIVSEYAKHGIAALSNHFARERVMAES